MDEWPFVVSAGNLLYFDHGEQSGAGGRMKYVSLIAFCLVNLTLAGTAMAHEENFEERVRDYILANPEIILRSLEVLNQRQVEAEIAQKLSGYPEILSTTALGMGAAEAPNKVVEFFDYRCAPCKAIHPKLEALVEEHPDLRIEMLQLPILSPGSERAARFALATEQVAGAAAYAQVHDALWAMRGPLNEGGFKEIADDLALDFEAIKAEMQSAEVDAEIDRNRDLAIDLGILGTPAFVTSTSVQYGSTDVDALAEIWLSQ